MLLSLCVCVCPFECGVWCVLIHVCVCKSVSVCCSGYLSDYACMHVRTVRASFHHHTFIYSACRSLSE